MAIVTLLSDFGSRDQYVSEMKGTIITLCPSASVVDISHEIEKYNIRMGAFILAAASRYFPAGAIHVAVVDPGVGGQRRGLLIETRKAVYIGSDNGILMPAVLRDGIKEAYSIENQRFMRSPVSSTFHGRDVFAYTAGKIACGADPSEVGPRISDMVSATFAEAVASHDRIRCEVLVTDSFGNIVTTAGEKHLGVAGVEVGGMIAMRAKGRLCNLNVVRSYSDAAEGRAVLLVGSHGLLEVAINKGNAAKRFRVGPGDKLILMSGRGHRS
jgi:S-adenosylmethionine hydrolase